MNPEWWTPVRVASLLASNPRAHKTDVMAEFADASASAIPVGIDRAFRSVPRFVPMSAPIGVLDSSAGRGDAFTWCVAQWCITNPEVRYLGETIVEGGFTLQLDALDGAGLPIPEPGRAQPEIFMLLSGWGSLDGQFREGTRFDALIGRIARHWKSAGCARGIGDQFQAWPIESEMSKYGITYRAQAWGQANKTEALALARNWFRDGQIVIDAGAETARVRTELVQLQVKPASGGGETIGARRGGHDDRAALVLNAAILDALGAFRGSPIELASGFTIQKPDGSITYHGGARPPL